ncbi:TlpA disulfide reductase family protein [Xylophilus sp. GOD-11R]|uniref:TlpA family protein disulfide reductase n=1 Tax=Xylophilus sp. GOD-11R TaxID=3089814 RepID=UPI00298D30D1|nr:TlpA disulfide reductase family protein [Xylophilus sp. GOD-11R]WPB56169.1 TlpA disulfide reductase family protein [Xylophilus sp. GOD-11R]
MIPSPDPQLPPATKAGNMRRRALWWGAAAVAGVGAAAGGVFAWRAGQVGAERGDALWAQSFETPDGQALDLAGLRSNRRLIVNFWATWCPPCVAELPMLDRFARDRAAQGWKVLGLAVDTPSSVRRFLSGRPVGFPIGMAGLQGTDLSRALGNAQGGLPFTVVFGSNGDLLHRKIGQLSEADLASWI